MVVSFNERTLWYFCTAGKEGTMNCQYHEVKAALVYHTLNHRYVRVNARVVDLNSFEVEVLLVLFIEEARSNVGNILAGVTLASD
jgi:uncharacterized pyridoxamine 5'-phosphate oxidase family protein